MRGNLVIINHDFAPFRQIYGQNAIYRQFDGANIGFDGYDGEIKTDFSSGPQALAHHHAQNIKYYLGADKVLRAKTWVRKERNLDAVFRNYFEPLIYRKKEEL